MVDEKNFASVHEVAQTEARAAANAMRQRMGSGFGCCGFAWVTVYKVRSNSKLGKALIAAGFRKAYDGGLQLWNPSNDMTQSIDIKEAGAEAYAAVLRENGLEAYAGSRMD